eukprot:3678992-Rhodomonas_salina.1
MPERSRRQIAEPARMRREQERGRKEEGGCGCGGERMGAQGGREQAGEREQTRAGERERERERERGKKEKRRRSGDGGETRACGEEAGGGAAAEEEEERGLCWARGLRTLDSDPASTRAGSGGQRACQRQSERRQCEAWEREDRQREGRVRYGRAKPEQNKAWGREGGVRRGGVQGERAARRERHAAAARSRRRGVSENV